MALVIEVGLDPDYILLDCRVVKLLVIYVGGKLPVTYR